MDSQLKYAFVPETKQPVYINDAIRKKAYQCCKCGAVLIPVMGREIDWHYRHKMKCDCTGGPEHAVHILTKQYICETNKIRIPSGYLYYENPKSEIKFGPIVPDVTAHSNAKELFFEVVFTHDMDSKKREFYINGNYTCYRIDYSKIPETISPDELKKVVLEDPSNKYLLCETQLDKEDQKSISPTFSEQIGTFIRENPITACFIFILGCILSYWFFKSKKTAVKSFNRDYRRRFILGMNQVKMGYN